MKNPIMFITTLLFAVSFGFASCADNPLSTSTSAATAADSTKQQPRSTALLQTLSPLPDTLVRRLFAECDYIDYLFYNWGFSVSITEKANVQTSLQQIGSVAPPLLGCGSSIGRVTFLGGASIIIEAEIHFKQSQCAYFVFLDKDKKPAYAALMTQQGINFFNQLQERSKKGK